MRFPRVRFRVGGRESEGYCVMVLHWTGDRNRKTGSDAADDIIRQARTIEQQKPRVVPFQPARFHGQPEADRSPEPAAAEEGPPARK